MTPPIRLLHFADLHIGVENYGRLDVTSGVHSRARDFLDRLEEVVTYAARQPAEVVVFAGDVFKTRDPDVTQQREFARYLKRLAAVAPVVLLAGNHDLPATIGRATSVDIFSALEVPNVSVGRTIGSQVIATAKGPVFVAWVPFPVRNRLLTQETYRGASIEELDRAVTALVVSELERLASLAAEQPMPRVLVGHFSVGGAVFGSERNVMLGRDIVIPRSALSNPAWDYVALGHIHKHQCLRAESGAERQPPLVYSGSLERVDFGEEADAKGFCWVQLVRGATEWEFVPVNARPFRTIKVDARSAADPTTAVLAAIDRQPIAGAVVRVQVQVRAEQEAALRRREIERALAAAFHVAAVSVEVEREVRLAGGGEHSPALTPPQWLERYFRAKNKPAVQIERLLAAAEELWRETA